MNSMTIPDEAVEAASNAIHRALASDWMSVANALAASDDVNDAYPRLLHDLALSSLTAALPRLHPAIPNTVEALEALPIGSVIQTAGTTPIDDTGVYTRCSYGWAGAGSYAVPTSSKLAACAEAELGLPGWIVLWPLGGAIS